MRLPVPTLKQLDRARGPLTPLVQRELRGSQGVGVASNNRFDRLFALDSLQVRTLTLTDVQTPFLVIPLAPLRLTPLGPPAPRPGQRAEAGMLAARWAPVYQGYHQAAQAGGPGSSRQLRAAPCSSRQLQAASGRRAIKTLWILISTSK